MKVLLIGFFTKTYMPYTEIYEEELKKNKIEYDIIFFDRNTTKAPIHYDNVYIYSHKTTTNRLAKLLPGIQYARYVKKIMKNNKYDKIILFTTMPGILLYRILLRKYKNKYLYDYRDYTYEKYNFYKKRVNKLIDYSFATFVSSEGYKKYFNDQKNIYLSHNISNQSEFVEKSEDLSLKNKINIGFLGYVRYFDVNTKLIDDLKNNDRYSLTYAGTAFSDCDLEGYCKENDIHNVSFIPEYDNSEKAKLYKNIDMINSIYSLTSEEVQPAIPNRLYDAALFKKPIIVNEGTYLSQIVKEHNLGLIVDPFKQNLKKEIENYLADFNSDRFTKKCNDFLTEIKDDEKNMAVKINEFIQ